MPKSTDPSAPPTGCQSGPDETPRAPGGVGAPHSSGPGAFSPRRWRVYVAGPLGRERAWEVNTNAAIEAADWLHAEEPRIAALVPHAHGVRYQQHRPRGYEWWMGWDLAWLEACDAVLRLPGESPGADREVARALELGLPVFSDPADLVWHLRRSGGE